MNCDYLVLLFLGLTNKDPGPVSENISEVLREVAKYCHQVSSDNDLVPFGPGIEAVVNARRNHIRIPKFNQIPITMQNFDLFQVINNNRINNEIVTIPVNAILNLVSPDQLHSLYRNKQAINVPSNDPFAPKLVALSKRVLEILIKAKQRMHEAINQGVLGAEHIFSGIHGGFGALNDLIGGSSHIAVDLIG